MAKKRLGEVLVERGSLTEVDLNRAIAIQLETRGRLGEVLLETGSATKSEIASAVEQVQGVGYAACPPESIAAEPLALIPRAIAVRCCALPLDLKDNVLVVAMAEPQNLNILDELRFSSGKSIAPRFSFREDILEGIAKFYGDAPPSATAAHTPAEAGKAEPDEEISFDELEFITSSTREENIEAMKELRAGMRQRTFAVRLVSMILISAAQRGASDVHIEPRVGSGLVRFRIDGLLREMETIPNEHHASVISRIKILADMDIGERRVPQDGRFLMMYRGRRLDLRVSSLPTNFGEKIVMRLLDPRSSLVTFEQLGLSKPQSEAIVRLLAIPQGMLIVTGPTGSGKSTTLYAALSHVRSPERNIITVEDPIEYMLDGVNQVQVHPRAGLTFASCLPSILRQDPDIIMIGEIRDAETAEIALKASLTGHLVLSTLHTNDSIAAITRLLDLGVPSYLIGSVNGVIGQRLLRKLCTCRVQAPADTAYRQKLTAIGAQGDIGSMYRPGGCSLCDHTGYKGRVGIYELLLVESLVRDAVYAEARVEDIRSHARSIGFVSMNEDAIDKVKRGLTTPEEVMRVIPRDSVPVAWCSSCSRESVPGFPYCPFCGMPRTDRRSPTTETAREPLGPLVHVG